MSPSYEEQQHVSNTNPLIPLNPLNRLEDKFPIVMEGSNGQLTGKISTPKKSIPVVDIPDIRLPFPPPITAYELFEKFKSKELNKSQNIYETKSNNTGKKAPNKFLIYRLIFVEALRSQNFHYSMTHISGIIAQKWREESNAVKDYYTKLAEEVCSLTKRHYGEVSKKKGKRGQNKPIIRHNYQIANEPYGPVEQLDPSNIPCNYSLYNQYSYVIPSSHINHVNHLYSQLPSTTFLQPQPIYQDNNEYQQFKQEPYAFTPLPDFNTINA